MEELHGLSGVEFDEKYYGNNPRTTPVVREKVLNDDQGLRSFYSLNPWLFSLTPPAWQKSDRKVFTVSPAAR